MSEASGAESLTGSPLPGVRRVAGELATFLELEFLSSSPLPGGDVGLR